MRQKLNISGYYTTTDFVVYTRHLVLLTNCEKSDKSAMKYFDSSDVYLHFQQIVFPLIHIYTL